MEIAIIGAGSIGMLAGSYLAEAGLDITMVVRRTEQQHALNEKGICRKDEDGTKSLFNVKAVTDMAAIKNAKLIILAVKYGQLKDIVEELKSHNIRKPLLFLQNGIGHLNIVDAADFPHVSFASVEHGALKTDDSTVWHNGVGKITIGEWFGEAEQFDIVERAHRQEFPIIRHHNAEQILLRKVLINCLINPLTTILGAANGELVANPHCHQLMQELYVELIQAFPEMEEELPISAVEAVCRRTARNYSSMLTDRLAGRPMEIETIVSAVILLADRKHQPLPLLQTYEKILLVLDGKDAR